MKPPTHCLECNAPLSEAETQGLCPRCLLKFGLATQLAGSTDPAPPPGQVGPLPLMPFDFGGYRILRLLGKGGMGAVYEAEDLESGRHVALKALGHSLDSAETRKRFLREGRLAASINHPNSVYVYGTEEIDGAPVITMELVSGGTLHERVKTKGPMPVAEAVDAILQVIGGLEAAHAVGILHRDIKPSNCFIDPSGAVKIGDFGLSISTVARGDSALTLAGSVLGTPEFSSPEQLRGEELNVRSDIYSVGMTLYYLLTGKTAFHAENLVQLLATVLDKPAPSPRHVRPDIPEELARVVMRCLAKQAGDRFASYDELRRALLPFDSTAPTPATLGLRFVAGCIDQMCLIGMNLLVTLIMGSGAAAFSDPATFQTPQWMLIVLALQLAFFAIPEGLWGASVGKALVGLRVARLDRSAPGIWRAFARAAFYMLPGLIGFLRFGAIVNVDALNSWHVAVMIADVLWFGILFSTARRRNGFAGLQDLLTKTRVIQKSAYQPRTALAPVEELVLPTASTPTIGPYHVLSTLLATEDEKLFLGFDTKLLRRVWIREVRPSKPPVPAALRHAGRPGRLRWLQGHRTETESWDVYECVPGTPLVNLLREPQPWKTVRHWLLDLAEEIAVAAADGSMPAALALERVWITTGGRAKLLDFRAPGADMTQAAAPVDVAESGAASIFLNQVAISALEGRMVSPTEAGTLTPAAPVPIAAREFLRKLRLLPDLAVLRPELKSLIAMVPHVSRRRRAGLILGCSTPALVAGGMFLMAAHAYEGWKRENPQIHPLMLALDMHDSFARGKSWGGIDAAKGLQAMELHIAGRFGNVIRDPKLWGSRYATSAIPPKRRAIAERIVATHPHPSPEEMDRAAGVLAPIWNEHGEFNIDERGEVPHPRFAELIPKVIASMLGLVAALSLVCALAFRRGLLLRLLGIAVVTRNGMDASRLRMLWRGTLAWSPVIVGGVALALLMPLMSLSAALVLVLLPVCGLVIWSAVLRDRSLQDRVAGTWLVPR